MQIMQEIRNEHFMIGRDSNLGFRALGRLQDVNAACADPGELCTGSVDNFDSKADFVNFRQCFKIFFI